MKTAALAMVTALVIQPTTTSATTIDDLFKTYSQTEWFSTVIVGSAHCGLEIPPTPALLRNFDASEPIAEMAILGVLVKQIASARDAWSKLTDEESKAFCVRFQETKFWKSIQ